MEFTLLKDNIRKDLLNGKPIIIVDDYDRENEGDLCIAAEKANEHNLAFLVREGGGLMCIPCTGDRLDRLKIPMMVDSPTDKLGTPFTVSVDALHGTTSGMSVKDRLVTIDRILSPTTTPTELSRPGHMFPLRAKPKLLQERRGHTESSVELMRWLGLQEVSIIVEIMDEFGSMRRGKSLDDFAKYHGLNVISVNDIYRIQYGEGV